MKTTLLALLTLITVSFSSPSKALVGLSANDDGLAMLGLAFMDISQIVIVDQRTYRSSRGATRFGYATVRVVTYVPLALFGLFMLDDETGVEQFGDITEEMAEKNNLTNDEFEALQEPTNKQMINNLLQTVGHKMSLKHGRQQRFKASQKFWQQQENEGTLPPAALSGLKKIAKGPSVDEMGPIGNKMGPTENK